MFEIRICPDIRPSSRRSWSSCRRWPKRGRRPARPPGGEPGPAPLADTPAHASSRPAEAEETVTSDIPGPSSGKADLAYGPEQVFEALQDYARVNGEGALKEVLERFGARRVSDLEPEHFAEVMTIARDGLT